LNRGDTEGAVGIEGSEDTVSVSPETLRTVHPKGDKAVNPGVNAENVETTKFFELATNGRMKP